MVAGRTLHIAIIAALASSCPHAAAGRLGGIPSVGADARRLAPLARDLAQALNDTALRRRLDAALGSHRWVALDPAIVGRPCLLLSMPVPAHRAAWSSQSGAPLLVAVGLRGLPLAFDPTGTAHRLDPTRPPQTPVLVLSEPGGQRGCHGWLCTGVPPLPRTVRYLLPEAAPPDLSCAGRSVPAPAGAATLNPRTTPTPNRR